MLKVWFQGGVGLVAVGWWLWQRDLHATLGAVVVLLVLSLWSMSRERIRRNLTGDRAESGLAGRADDDWSSLGRPLLCLDEINLRRKSQEKKDRMAFRIGILYTVLAGVIVALGFQK